MGGIEFGECLVFYGEVDDGGGDAQDDGADPDGVVGAGRVVYAAAQPDTQKTADLMAEEDDSIQGGQVACSEDLGYGSTRQWDCGEPEETDHGGEDQCGCAGDGNDKEAADDK